MPLWPHEAKRGDLTETMRTAEFKLQMLKYDKLVNENFWGALLSRFQDNEKVAKLKAALPQFEAWFVENLAGKNFIGGDQPMYIDMHAYVVMERVALLDGSPW